MRKLALLLTVALAACATTPAGSPPASPRENALQVDQFYALVQTGVNTAVSQPTLSASVKKQIATASDAATAGVLAYSHAADKCFRDPATGVIGNAPSNPAGVVCDPTALGNAEAVAWVEMGQVNGLLAILFPSAAAKLPAAAPQ